jgi:hypothetical protein
MMGCPRLEFLYFCCRSVAIITPIVGVQSAERSMARDQEIAALPY